MTSLVPDVKAAAAPSPQAAARLVSFDGGIAATTRVQRPDRYRYFTASNMPEGRRISRGAGLSYAAASFGEGGISVEHGAFNRILGFDSAAGTVRVEPGITLLELHRFLAGKQLYLPIQPGHGSITVGGCVAADVHGKNHQRDGSFVNQVLGLTLFHPDHGELALSRTDNPSLFELTCGGYGLTGHIVSVDLRASPLPGASVHIQAHRTQEVESGFEQLRRASLQADFAYSWHDFARGGSGFGAGFTVAASFSDTRPERGRGRTVPQSLTPESRGQLPISLLNRWTAGAFNRAYSLRTALAGVRTVDVASALFPAQEAQVYFKLFGRGGFHEYQVVVPWANVTSYMSEIHDYVRGKPLAVTLASAKCFGASRKLLRFSGEGLCFALNIPRDAQAPAFLQFLDRLLPQVGGIPNLIKDSRLPRSVVDACYAEADLFRSQLGAFDPKRRFRSELSTRLGL